MTLVSSIEATAMITLSQLFQFSCAHIFSEFLLVDIMHDVSWPSQFNLQLTLVFHKEVHQRPGYSG